MDIPRSNNFELRFQDPVWLEIAAQICRLHCIKFGYLSRAEHGENIVVLIDDRFIVKIYTPKKNGFDRERAGLAFVQGKTSLPVARVLADGFVGEFRYLITERLAGGLMLRQQWITLSHSAQVGLLTQLAHGLRELHSHDASEIKFDWHKFIETQIGTVIERQRREGGNPEWLESLPKYLETYLPLLPTHTPSVFMHGDVHFGNLRVTENPERPVISGLFDFADSLTGFYEYEFVAIGVLMIQGQGDLQREFFLAYGYLDSEINLELRRRLMLLTILYEHSSLRRYAERLGPGSEKLSLHELERAIWNFV
jgi:aminoglycoside phosphotransferase